MKTKLLFASLMASCFMASAQKVTNGPELDNDRDCRMNRMIQGDDNSFYTYRIRTKGRGTSYFVEKYDKGGLKPVFSKELDIEEDRYTKVEDVEYAQGNVYLFIRQYNKDADKMTLFYRTVSSSGAVAPKLNEILNVKTDHYEFVDFDVYLNPSATKFLVKASYKANKEDSFKTDFVLYDAKTMKKESSKTVDRRLFSTQPMVMGGFFGMTFNRKESNDFVGLMLDDAGDIYYGYSYTESGADDKDKHYKLAVDILNAKDNEPKTVAMTFDDDYYVGDINFSKNTTSNEIVVGGFLKDVIERKGRDLVKVGIFSFTINLDNNNVKSKTVKMFDDQILTALESNPKRAQYFKYKIDYMFPIGKDIFYVGEQYREQMVTTYDANTHQQRTYWEYEYMDVIVAKLDEKGEFEWVHNTPLRINMTLNAPHVFKQYIAVPTAKFIYILNDEHEKNLERYAKPDFEPKDLKNMSGIHGTNFICSSVSTSDGKVDHKLVFANEDYCFAPVQEKNFAYMPPADTEIFVPGKSNDIYIYTEDRGRDRFCKIVFE